jgi:hypothetical protein
VIAVNAGNLTMEGVGAEVNGSDGGVLGQSKISRN